jgi:iron(III) transport system ATP-binding protein
MKSTAAVVEAGSVRVDGVRFHYPAKRSAGQVEDLGDVLDGVSLDVPAGRTLALLGPSGCGKTTLLRSIAGLERPSQGSVSIADELLSGPDRWVPAERRRVGMVFQDWALFPHLSVGKNVGYGLHKLDRGERDLAIDKSLALVGLGGMADRMPATLSGGQQQRVALARALAPKPRVLLLDEPFSNLDTNLRAEVRAEVHHLLLDLGITAIFVTHDQEEAFVLGDQVAVMNAGRIEQIGTPHNIYTAPSSRWVAQFVGEASLLRGVASGHTAGTPLGEIALETELSGAVDVLIRPEQLSITSEGHDATVELVEFYGHDAMVYLDLDGQSIRARTEPNVRFRRGDRVNLTYTGEAAVSFPAE